MSESYSRNFTVIDRGRKITITSIDPHVYDLKDNTSPRYVQKMNIQNGGNTQLVEAQIKGSLKKARPLSDGSLVQYVPRDGYHQVLFEVKPIIEVENEKEVETLKNKIYQSLEFS